MYSLLYYSARIAIRKYCSPGGLNNRNLYPHSSGGQKSQNQGIAGPVSGENSSWLADSHLLAVTSYGRVLVSLPLLLRILISSWGGEEGHFLTVLSKPSSLQKTPTSKYCHIGIRAKTYGFGGKHSVLTNLLCGFTNVYSYH